ncbi:MULTISPECIES: DUF1120 domain-containing protein [unclassified Pseudomonas]|uniref:DUF1120 domain-containing protein n=1 Tax=unclassified Pseudomonas TaxID=196821 RepID=UPI0008125328|nr:MULTISPECIES: DUF1120 domain-containing protein [unclassified Pseudomonas]CRL96495.1 hypothetical protein [Pseudomonas sp. 24 E 1]CRL99093.1 hypothetical protein [Pseudomonas sp. 24 R 17]CRM02894.1 hypothetical protein [Pseudomonas sp. 52 E 6]
MNKSLTTLIAAALLAFTGQAVAASSVDLTVKGLITPSACTPALSNGGAIDYGKISAKDLKPDLPTQLPQHILQLTVTCDAATLMAIEGKDNREGTDYGNDLMYFGLGLINGTEKLGRMSIRLLSPLADGVAARTIASMDNGLTWYLDRYVMRDNILSVADSTTVAPVPVQVFSSDFAVVSDIAPASQLTLNNEVAIDGSVTLTVRYL